MPYLYTPTTSSQPNFTEITADATTPTTTATTTPIPTPPATPPPQISDDAILDTPSSPSFLSPDGQVYAAPAVQPPSPDDQISSAPAVQPPSPTPSPQTTASQAGPETPPVNTTGTDVVVKALYAWTPNLPSELGLSVGEEICVEEISERGWAYGVCVRSGERGWFPGNYVRLVG
ncbi:hypothetical protein P154DRAFT_622785 [Amniculicola lignicola CBS 123094]|uniref:SH3 domain-containing protein n=1 Tax=Amniculicola lignicola CBS 123094 TaxID=1392246 RepID=A0A6A5WCX9_9PLEO|nr:hypothetical protein P154DRAFT_622785 [Amniculicola lignicola CBS 123094]